jgi:hypothetical protein
MAYNALFSGEPNQRLEKGILDEHCLEAYGCNISFSTTHGKETTPLKEFEIVQKAECPVEDVSKRKIREMEDLKKLQLVKNAGLTEQEIIAVVRCPSNF